MNRRIGVDGKLVPRIKEYVELNDGAIIDVEEMAETLQKLYGEYARRKKNAFKKAVHKAYDSIVVQGITTNTKQNGSTNFPYYQPKLSMEISSEESSQDSASSSADEDNTRTKDRNTLNNSLQNLYSKGPSNKRQRKMFTTVVEEIVTSSQVKENDEVLDNNEKHKRRMEKVNRKRKFSEQPNQLDEKKRFKSHSRNETPPEIPMVKFADVIGYEDTLIKLYKLFNVLNEVEHFKSAGMLPPRGILIHGPTGCGKTLLALAIAGQLNRPLIKVELSQIISSVSGGSEKEIRHRFEMAKTSAPCVLFIDEIDSIAPKRELTQRGMESRIITELVLCLQDLSQLDASTEVLVVGATNRLDTLDGALRQPGRLDLEISMGMPDEDARHRILKFMCSKFPLSNDFNLKSLATRTPGFAGRDLMGLSREAFMNAINRKSQLNLCSPDDSSLPKQEKIKSELKQKPWLLENAKEEGGNEILTVQMIDFDVALKEFTPASRKEGLVQVPEVTWDDVGALYDIKEELKLTIMGSITHPQVYKNLGLTVPAGILLYGPPGCGKTLLAKAMANEVGVNFMSVKGPELIDKYVGESERFVRERFQQARNQAPCIIFFDEIDALCPRRTADSEGKASDRVVAAMLLEMDGFVNRKGVIIFGATNRLENIDPAICRPGRLEQILFVGFPTAEERLNILQTITKLVPKLASDVNLEELAKCCEGFTGADLAGLVRQAAKIACKEFFNNHPNSSDANTDVVVAYRHLVVARGMRAPSVSVKDQKKYRKKGKNLEKMILTEKEMNLVELFASNKLDCSTELSRLQHIVGTCTTRKVEN